MLGGELVARPLRHPRNWRRIEVRDPLLHGVQTYDRVVSEDIMAAIWAFFVLYIICVAAATLLLGLAGLSFETALSLAAAAVSNSGPAAGLIAPAEVAGLSDGAKWILCGAMLMGRLEILTLLTLINPSYWRA